MSNESAHRVGAAAVVGLSHLYLEGKEQEQTAMPAASAVLAYAAGTLPDVLEPAISPNHRQFFHSFAVAGLLGHGVWRLWQWEPETDGDKVLKGLGLIIGSAYLVHLAMDATTPRALPVL